MENDFFKPTNPKYGKFHTFYDAFPSVKPEFFHWLFIFAKFNRIFGGLECRRSPEFFNYWWLFLINLLQADYKYTGNIVNYISITFVGFKISWISRCLSNWAEFLWLSILFFWLSSWIWPLSNFIFSSGPWSF